LHQNDPGLSFSQFAVPHRIVGALSYNFEGLDFMNGALKNTTISLYYQGSNQGRLSFVYSTDMNGDGNNADLMYIPANDSEINFTDIMSGDAVVNTAAEQREAFWAFVEQDDYLRENKGSYAERYGALMPWYHKFDFRLLQDLAVIPHGNRTHSLQLSLDILNVGNLINSNWGIQKRQVLGNYDITLLRYTGANDEGEPVYQLNKAGGEFPTTTYVDVLSIFSTWGAQIGLRYTF
jgi:hypothetical protein